MKKSAPNLHPSPNETSAPTIGIEEILNSFPTGILILNKEGEVLNANDQAAHLLGLPTQNLKGRNLCELLPLGCPAVLDAIESSQEGIGLVVPELANCFIHLAALPTPGLGVMLNIFDPRLWQSYCKIGAATDPLGYLLTKVFDATTDHINVSNQYGSIVFVNQAAATWAGVNKNELLGRHISYLVKKNFLSSDLALEVINTGKSVAQTYKSPKSNCDILATAIPIFNPAQEVELVVVSERELVEIDSQDENLRQQNKMLEDFKAEITGLLRSTIGHTQTLLPSEAALTPASAPSVSNDDPSLMESTRCLAEKNMLLEALSKSRNTREMADYLGISQASVSRKLRKHGLAPPKGSKR